MMKFTACAAAALILTGCVATDGTVTAPVSVPAPIIITPAPIIITDKAADKASNTVHVCKISAFTSTYRSENTSRGKAKLDAQKQCLAHHHAMFCQEKYITCDSYE